jgi:hypothetical protein
VGRLRPGEPGVSQARAVWGGAAGRQAGLSRSTQATRASS